MTLSIDNVKIKYSQEGYLPNYPPHLISDEEMFNAFLNEGDISYFYDKYPLINQSLSDEYKNLVEAIKYHINKFLDSDIDLPNWVYSYMLGEVVHQYSDVRDKHYLLINLGCDNIEDDITSEAQLACYKTSETWVKKLNYSDRYDSNGFNFRPPTMFGEPHVIKAIRLNEVNV